MIDREKVVKAVETCFNSWIDKHRNMGLVLDGVEQMKHDVLELLKEQTVSDWISVKDRLPEKNGEYLISTRDGVTSAYYERGRRTSEWTDYFEGYIDFEPTHWMPLPEQAESCKGGEVG